MEVREKLNINLDKYENIMRDEFPLLSEEEIKDFISELYSFLEDYYYLQIND